MQQEQEVLEAHLKEFQINGTRAEKVCHAMWDIWMVCCTRDGGNLEKMVMSDLGLSMLKLAQIYGESGEGNRGDFFDNLK